MKKEMVEKLITFPKSSIPKKRGGSGYGKPGMPTIADNLRDAPPANIVGQSVNSQ